MLRTVEELGETIRNNPFVEAGAPENWLHVLFLASQPDARVVAALDPAAERGGENRADERLLRRKACHGDHGTELANRTQTFRSGPNWKVARFIPSVDSPIY
jgi:hypothetical protein